MLALLLAEAGGARCGDLAALAIEYRVRHFVDTLTTSGARLTGCRAKNLPADVRLASPGSRHEPLTTYQRQTSPSIASLHCAPQRRGVVGRVVGGPRKLFG